MIRELLLVVGLALYGGVGWRLRGGAFTALTGWNPGGTDGARFIFGGLWMAAPCALLDWRALALAPAFWLTLKVTGWGGYFHVYHNPPDTARRDPYDWILRAIGLGSQSLWHNLVGLALCGLVLCGLPADVVAWLAGWRGGVATFALGLWLPLAYWLAVSLRPPLLGRLVDNEIMWGEVLVGAVLAPGLFLAMGG